MGGDVVNEPVIRPGLEPPVELVASDTVNWYVVMELSVLRSTL